MSRVYVIIGVVEHDDIPFSTCLAVCSTLPLAQKTVAELEEIALGKPERSELVYKIDQWPVALNLDGALLGRCQPMPNKPRQVI